MPNSLDTIRDFVNAPLFYIGQTAVTLGGIGSAFLVILGSFLISAMVQHAVTSRLKGRLKMEPGMLYALGRILHYLILVMGAIVASQCVGLNFGSLAVVFGFLSVGIGFGLQNITSNFISGLIVLLERPISVGDLISVEDKIGTVVNIRIRSTVINTLDNVSIIIPNSKFIEGQVTNWSYGDPRVRIRCPVGVAYGSDTDKVREVLLKSVASHPDILKTPAPEAYFRAFGSSSLDFELCVWLANPGKQMAMKSDINFAIGKALTEAGITIPFPQRDVLLQMTPAVEMLAGALAQRPGPEKSNGS